MNTKFASVGIFSIVILTCLVSPAAAIPAVIVTKDPNGYVNVRAAASAQSKQVHCANNAVGLEVVSSKRGQDGYIWHQVSLNRQGAGGWIREDFLKLNLPSGSGKTWTGKCGIQLNPGLYYGGGSRYITIATKGDRFCYSGSSASFDVVGSTTGSIHHTPDATNVYQVHNFDNGYLKQKDSKTLLFGNTEKPYERESDAPPPSGKLLSCLNATEPFFEQTSEQMGGRSAPGWMR